MNDTILRPLISILTPVYNGERYLDECIQSVLGQTYDNWEYIIVNNVSTDRTLEIATKYANHDSRIRVINNLKFVNVIENHNIAFRMISRRSIYCKVVSADDYLFPECIHKLVEIAECHPNVSIVGSYAVTTNGVHRIGLPTEQSVFDGREVCRLYLLGVIDAFGTPSATLYRSTVVRTFSPFFPGESPNADFAACLTCLEHTDFAFVHQILSYERIHSDAISASVRELHGFLIDRLQFLLEYGPAYVTLPEQEARAHELLKEIYKSLATGAVHLRGRPFWEYQRNRLAAIGCPVNNIKLAIAVCSKIADFLFIHPTQTIDKLLRQRKTETADLSLTSCSKQKSTSRN